MGVIENRFNMKITEEELLDLIATDVKLLGFKTSISFLSVTWSITQISPRERVKN
jgi:hypothetical protein